MVAKMIALPMTSEIVIRPMHLDDLEQVQAIDSASFSMPWPSSSYRYELKENPFSLLYVAEAQLPIGQSCVVGMVVVWLIMDEAHIATIAVRSEYRKRGISQRMLAFVLQESIRKGARTATLEVRAQNTVAQALYRSFQFEVVGRRSRYYHDNNEDALLMTVDLHQIDEHGQTYLEWLVSRQCFTDRAGS
jgi:ribosomal-protein-alanine N-acetyltransferase